jgi:hypothetical protein
MTESVHYQKSSLREKIVEHVFIGEALRMLWCKKIVDAEILRSEFDAFGYDLVLERGNVTRHVQLKSGLDKPSGIGVAQALAKKKSGCVVYVQISENLDLQNFYWFGGEPSNSLPAVDQFPLLKRTRPNKAGVKLERQNYRSLPTRAFEGPINLSDLLQRLLGR